MPRIKIHDNGVQVWLSANDTYAWAHRSGSAWPCSELSDHRVFAEFDDNGLLDMTIDGKTRDCDATEFNAITSDFISETLPKDHPVYFVTVGQFQEV